MLSPFSSTPSGFSRRPPPPLSSSSQQTSSSSPSWPSPSPSHQLRQWFQLLPSSSTWRSSERWSPPPSSRPRCHPGFEGPRSGPAPPALVAARACVLALEELSPLALQWNPACSLIPLKAHLRFRCSQPRLFLKPLELWVWVALRRSWTRELTSLACLVARQPGRWRPGSSRQPERWRTR